VGYVLGSKAGRKRYEQIVGTYKALTGNPATKTVIDAGRRKIADRVSPDPDPKMVTLTEIDTTTTVVEPQRSETQ
jgi:aspartate aminotransferase-like enzyme